MMQRKLGETLSPLFLLINSVTWFSLMWFVIRDLLEKAALHDVLVVSASFYGAFLVFAFIGATVLYKNLRKKIPLSAWIIIGTSTCILFVLAVEKTLFNLAVISFISGALAGTGIPTCLAFFADYTKIENRGLIGAAVFFVIQLLTVLIYSLSRELTVDNKFIILGIWRLLGITSLLFYKPLEKMSEVRKLHPSSLSVGQKSFAFYFIAWFFFCIVNFVEAPLLEHFFGSELFSIYMMAGIIIASLSAFPAGMLCDLKGRKTASIAGFALLGISYAILSFFPGMLFTQFLFTLLEGIAWGILYTIFVFVIWGDLSEAKVRERYYFIGDMPFLLSGLIGVFVQPFVEFIPITMSFSLASFFLFLAILPLLYASETLPEKKIKERELKQYIEKAKKIKEKYD